MADDSPTKKTRRPRAELKELMIQGGVEVLQEMGVETQLSSVSYARVFEHLETTQGVRVTYGSVHERIWNSLQEYQLSVIERAGVWDDTTGIDDDRWADWLQTAVALSSAGADESVREAAAHGARTTYAGRADAVTPSDADPADLLPPDADPDEVFARLSVALVDGLRLRSLLSTGSSTDADTQALADLGHAILSAWRRAG